MTAHSALLPRRIVTGSGSLKKIPEVIAELGIAKKPFLVVDETTKDICGDDIFDSLKNARMGVIKDSTFDEVDNIIHLSKGSSCIVSAGGGKVLDVGKLAAHRTGIPFVSVPTAPSHDGISSSITVIRQDGRHNSVEATMPLAIVADTDIIAKAPAKLIAAGCGDIMAKITAVRDWKLARARGEPYSEAAAGFSLLSTKIIMDSADEIAKKSEAGINDLVLALITSGSAMSLFGSSRPGSGSENLFAHALDQLGSKALHGEAAGIGAIIMAYWQEKNSKDSAVRNSGVWRKIAETLKTVGAPTTFKEAGIEPEAAYQAIVDAPKVMERHTILNEFPIKDAAAAQKICAAAGLLG